MADASAIFPPRIVLFDGVCNLCNGSVQFLLRHDHREQLRFASLQSDAGQKILAHFDINAAEMKSVIFIRDGKVLTQSSAVLALAWQLGGVWRLAYIGAIVPKFLRDAAYNFVARRRYRWFGQSATCWLPTEALKARFLN